MKYALLLLLFLSGCFPHCYRSRPLELGCTDLRENVDLAFQTSSVCGKEILDQRWWTFFQDPQLDWLIETSLACHPDIKIAEARIALAEQQAIEARSALLPHFFLFGDLKRQKQSQFDPHNLFPPFLNYLTQTTLYLTSARFELDLWKKNRHHYYAALDQVFAQIADYEEAKLILAGAIASVYFDLQYNLSLLALAKGRLEAREETFSLLMQRFKNGVIAEFNLYETDTEIELLRDRILQQEGLIQIDKHALAALVGNLECVCGGDLNVEPAAIFETPLPIPCSLSLDLLARRPDVIAQRWRVEEACFEIEVAKARFFPSIDLFGYIGFTSIKIAELFTSRALQWIGEATGTLPLYTADKLEAKLGIARETLEIAVESYNQSILNAVQQVSDALTDLTIADARSLVLNKSVENARALYKLTDEKYVNGVANRIALLNATENLLIQESVFVEVQLTRFQAAVALIQAIGGGYHDHCFN